MEFWGKEAKPGMIVCCKVVNGSVFHLTQVALGEINKRPETVVIYVRIGSKKFVIGTLSSDKHPQTMCNLVFNEDFELSHSSNTSSVFLCGYKSRMPDESDSGDSEDHDVVTHYTPVATSDSGKNEDKEVESDGIPVKDNVTGLSTSSVDWRHGGQDYKISTKSNWE